MAFFWIRLVHETLEKAAVRPQIRIDGEFDEIWDEAENSEQCVAGYPKIVEVTQLPFQ